MFNPLFPASGLATGSLNGLNPKSKFLAFINPTAVSSSSTGLRRRS